MKFGRSVYKRNKRVCKLLYCLYYTSTASLQQTTSYLLSIKTVYMK